MIFNTFHFFYQASLKRRGKDAQKSEKKTPQTPTEVKNKEKGLIGEITKNLIIILYYYIIVYDQYYSSGILVEATICSSPWS